MDFRKTSTYKFRTELRFKQYYVILTEKTISAKKIMRLFKGGNMQTQYNVSSYRIDLYFRDYKLPIEIDENRYSDRNVACEIKRQKAMEQELDYKFIRIDPDKEYFDVSRAINEIFRNISNQLKRL